MTRILSVLIAAYKAQRWIEECLESIRKQILPKNWDMEVLVGVDGCIDSLMQIRQYRAMPIKTVYMKKNRGTYVTFNTLMQYARGDLICRFDADDVMLESYLFSQIKRLASDVEYTTTWSIYTDEHLSPTSHIPAQRQYQPSEGKHCRGCEGTFILKREVWEELGGFRPWRCGADTDFYQRVVTRGFEVAIIPEFLYLRRTHAQSLTAHPDTNFESLVRKEIISRIDDYKEIYQVSQEATRIFPECNEVEAVIVANDELGTTGVCRIKS